MINYNLGQDMVAGFVERHSARAGLGPGETALIDRWRLFEWLLSTPQVPANLLV